MSPQNILTKSDKEHLFTITQQIDWNRIALVMLVLDWKYYHIPGRTPNAGELRDLAMEHLGQCIQEARSANRSSSCMSTGGFEYAVLLNTEDEERDTSTPAEVVYISCSFIVESSESKHHNPDGSHTTRNHV